MAEGKGSRTNEERAKEAARARAESAEVKLKRLFEKRNDINAIAREAREARDTLNDARRSILDSVAELRNERDLVNRDLQGAKGRRHELQAKAKALIEIKKGKRGKVPMEASARLAFLEREVQRMEMEHATHAMTVQKERDFLDKLRLFTKEANELRGTVSEGQRLLGEMKDLDSEIETLFQQADEEHRKVVELYEKAQALHYKIQPAYEEADLLRAKSDDLHKKAMESQEMANAYHEKAQALIAELDKLRGEDRAQRDEERQLVRDQRKAVDAALTPGEDDFESILEQLKTRGKVELRS